MTVLSLDALDLTRPPASEDSLDRRLRQLFSRQASVPPVNLDAITTALAPRYTIIEHLGSGGMGAVFLVEDRELGERCALKTLVRPGDLQTLLHLKSEFRTVGPLHHDNLVGLRELGCMGGVWYLTMDYVAGSTLTTWGEGKDPDALLGALRQMVDGLAALHELGILHRDIKPGNILVEHATGRVVLLDFGLAAVERATHTVLSQGGGTPAYVAPEQAQAHACRASDLYALGCVVHTLFAGCPPRPGRPLDLPAGTPPWAGVLCEGLVRHDPEARLGLDDVRALLGADSRSPRRRQPPMIGRGPELARVQDELRRAVAGHGHMLVVEGESGCGKTRLVQQALSDSGALVLVAAASPNERLALGVLDALTDQLVAYLVQRSRVTDEIANLAAPAARLFPTLGVLTPRQPGSESNALPGPDALLEPDAVRERAVHAWCGLLSLAAEQRGLVLVIDDLQWADADSVQVLDQALAGLVDFPVLVLATLNTDETIPSPIQALLESKTVVRRLSLQALSDEEILDIIGQRSAAAVDRRRLLQIAQGNAFVAAELAQAAREGLPTPRDLDGLLERQVHALPPPARRLLDLVCVAGSVPRAVLVRACEAEGIPWTEAFSPLLAASLLRATPDHEVSWRVYHSRFRTHLVRRLDQPVALHRVLATAYRGLPDAERHAETLLRHYDHTGDRPGRRWALQTAADQALDGLAFARAAEHQQALLLEYPPAEHEFADAWEEVARRFSLAGMLEAAIAARARALAACDAEPHCDATRLSRLWAQQGQDLSHSRLQAEAMDAWRRALRPLGLQPLQSTPRTLATVLALRARVALVASLPVRAEPGRVRDLLAEVHFWEQLAVALANTSFLALSEYSERARLAAHRAGSPRSAVLSEVLSLTSGTMASPTESSRRAAELRLQTLSERLDSPTPWERATLLAGQGMLQLQVDPDQAAQTFLRAYREAERAGMADSSMGAMIEAYVCNAAVDAGRYDQALAHCGHLERRRCVDTGDQRHGVLITATLTRARVAFFRGQADLARSVIRDAEGRVADGPMTVERQVLLALQMKLQTLDGDPAGALTRYEAHRSAL
ncbi:MAG: AAA family ATPase, partial [Oligoflexia bacterium]|nr:AAA family ATPase [Oligoflexia bacterium]